MRNLFKSPFLMTVLMMLISCNSTADFELGMHHYQEKNYSNAYKEFLDVAQYGDHDAQNNIGIMYLRGEHLPKNKILAYSWLNLATQTQAYKDSGLAQKVYAQLNDTEKAQANIQYQVLFGDFNDAALSKKLTPVFTGDLPFGSTPNIIKKNYARFPRNMLKMGKSGFVDLIFTIDKQGITRDHLVTFSSGDSFTEAAVQALRKNQYKPLLVNGKAVDINGIKLRSKFTLPESDINEAHLIRLTDENREQAKNGSANDKYNFAYFLEAAYAIAKDYRLRDNPNEWYMQAAMEGNSAASYFLGLNLLYGKMCQQNTYQSKAWLLKAAKAGITDAQYLLAIESFSGARFERNENKGFYWLNQAAASNPSAKLRYAWILSTHPDTTRRSGKLAREYLIQVDKNHLDQQTYLQTQAAVSAENGDFKQAVKWQQQAIKDAQELELPDQHLQQQLASYSAKQPWREEI